MDKVRKVVLMCDKKGCCPTVTLDKNKVFIEDDFGGKVNLSSEQFKILKNKIKKGEL